MSSKICRMCALPAQAYLSLFTTFKNRRSLTDQLESLSSVKVTLEDGLPTVICTKCVRILQNLEAQRRMIIEAQTKLLNYKEPETKNNEVAASPEPQQEQVKPALETNNNEVAVSPEPQEEQDKPALETNNNEVAVSPEPQEEQDKPALETKNNEVAASPEPQEEQVKPALEVSNPSVVSKAGVDSSRKTRCRVCHKLFSASMHRLHNCLTHDVMCNFCNAKLMCKCKSNAPVEIPPTKKLGRKRSIISCFHCTDSFENAGHLADHLKYAASKSFFGCNYCLAYFSDPAECNEHIANIHLRAE